MARINWWAAFSDRWCCGPEDEAARRRQQTAEDPRFRRAIGETQSRHETAEMLQTAWQTVGHWLGGGGGETHDGGEARSWLPPRVLGVGRVLWAQLLLQGAVASNWVVLSAALAAVVFVAVAQRRENQR